jgi:antiviral helicase SKI2
MANLVDPPMEKLTLEGNTFDSAAFDARLADQVRHDVEKYVEESTGE